MTNPRVLLQNHGLSAKAIDRAEAARIDLGQLLNIVTKYGPTAIKIIEDILQLISGVSGTVSGAPAPALTPTSPPAAG